MIRIVRPSRRSVARRSIGSTAAGWTSTSRKPENVLPVQVPAANVDGPFSNAVPIQQAILRNLHQCLVAEIAFDPAPIPVGKNPANWDKLAQRNLAWSDLGSAQAVSTFEIRPTRAGLPAGQSPDELMIDWGNIPSGSSAQIYLPAVNVDDVLSTAARMYTSHRLTRVDDHTLQCATGGITYVPIPPGGAVNYAGLLSVDLPGTGRRGETYHVIVRQVTNAFGKRVPPPPPPPGLRPRWRPSAPRRRSSGGACSAPSSWPSRSRPSSCCSRRRSASSRSCAGSRRRSPTTAAGTPSSTATSSSSPAACQRSEATRPRSCPHPPATPNPSTR